MKELMKLVQARVPFKFDGNRIVVTAAGCGGPSWFYEMSEKAQLEYVKQHPKSKYAQEYQRKQDAKNNQENHPGFDSSDMKLTLRPVDGEGAPLTPRDVETAGAAKNLVNQHRQVFKKYGLDLKGARITVEHTYHTFGPNTTDVEMTIKGGQPTQDSMSNMAKEMGCQFIPQKTGEGAGYIYSGKRLDRHVDWDKDFLMNYDGKAQAWKLRVSRYDD